jgi:hypothetical protein
MIYTAEMDDLAPETRVGSCGCGWEGTFADVAEIGDCCLTPGDGSPAGRCPECDGLCYPLGAACDIHADEAERAMLRDALDVLQPDSDEGEKMRQRLLARLEA